MTALDPGTIDRLGARLRNVSGYHPFVFEDAAKAWIVLDGGGAMYGSALEVGVPTGPRRALFSVAEGDLLLPAGSACAQSSIRMMVLAHAELILLEVTQDRLSDALAALKKNPLEAIEAWISKVVATFSIPPVPSSAIKITEPSELVLNGGKCVRGQRGKIAWVRIEQGGVHILGQAGLEVKASPTFLPILPPLWIEADVDTKLASTVGAELSWGNELLPGADRLHGLFLRYLGELDQRDQQMERERWANRDRMQRQSAEAAVDSMRAVLQRRRSIEPRASALLGAMDAIGVAIDVKMVAPPQSEALSGAARSIEAIARASRVRHRQVLLRGKWWKSDCGVLLAYRKAGHKPVALLPCRRGGYEIVEPDTRGRVAVSRTTATELEPEATLFYPRLPDKVAGSGRLVRFLLRGKSRDVAFVVGVATLATLVGMLTPLATAVVMDEAIPSADLRLLVELGLVLLSACVGTAMFKLSQGIASVRMAIETDVTALSGVWDRLLNLHVSFFRRFSSGDLLARVSALSEVSRELNGATVQTLLAALMSLLNFGLLMVFSVRLAMIAAGLALIVGLATMVSGYVMHDIVVALTEMRGRFFGLVVQMVNSVGKIRVAGAQERAFATWCRGYTRQLQLIDRAQFTQDVVGVFNLTIPMVGTILLFWIGTNQVVSAGGNSGSGVISIGVFLAFHTAMATFLNGVTALSTTAVSLLETASKVKRTAPILSAPCEVSDAKVDPGHLEGTVELAHVDFRYVDGGRKILDDLSLRAEAGSFVALVGPSGGGKSTVFRILLGFETPESGAVTYDGQDFAGLDALAVRRQLGVVLQTGRISSGSLLDHIGGGACVTLEDAWEAIEDAGLGDDVRAMPMGLHTIISEGGGNLSGGQRQRLLIARALVTRPKILLMDEATSALDNISQAIVTESLNRRSVTRIVIAHRLSTIRDAGRIYVLDRGRVVQQGRYDDLMADGGLFATMMARQTA